MAKVRADDAVSAAIAYLADSTAVISDPVRRFLALVGLGMAKASPDGAMARYRPMLDAVGAVDADGLIDTCALREALDGAFATVPRVTVLGIDFGASDVADFVTRIERGA